MIKAGGFSPASRTAAGSPAMLLYTALSVRMLTHGAHITYLLLYLMQCVAGTGLFVTSILAAPAIAATFAMLSLVGTVAYSLLTVLQVPPWHPLVFK